MARATSGGGLTSNKLVETNAPKAEPRSHNVDPRRPSEIGLSHHYTVPPLYQSTKASTPYGTTPGNDCRPGGNGRVILPSGSQSRTKAPTPMQGPRRDLFK
jgi:hypothetical protein